MRAAQHAYVAALPSCTCWVSIGACQSICTCNVIVQRSPASAKGLKLPDSSRPVCAAGPGLARVEAVLSVVQWQVVLCM